jgi:hypothetical protein
MAAVRDDRGSVQARFTAGQDEGVVFLDPVRLMI